MATSKATTVEAYLDELPAERRAEIVEVREVLRKNMPKGYKETVAFGMITYCVPLEKYASTYNQQPLGYVSLAAQKNYNALYLMGVYGDPAQRQKLEDGFRKAGKKLDMGKSCVRFRKAEDLPLGVIGELVASTPPDDWIAVYERSRVRK